MRHILGIGRRLVKYGLLATCAVGFLLALKMSIVRKSPNATDQTNPYTEGISGVVELYSGENASRIEPGEGISVISFAESPSLVNKLKSPEFEVTLDPDTSKPPTIVVQLGQTLVVKWHSDRMSPLLYAPTEYPKAVALGLVGSGRIGARFKPKLPQVASIMCSRNVKFRVRIVVVPNIHYAFVSSDGTFSMAWRPPPGAYDVDWIHPELGRYRGSLVIDIDRNHYSVRVRQDTKR